MIAYLVFCSLLIPANLWAAITPHLHSDLSMRVLHGMSTLALLPLLLSLWQGRQLQSLLPSVVLGVFGVMLVLVNSWITAMGMGVDFGWLDHVLLALAYGSVLVFFLLKPEAENRSRELTNPAATDQTVLTGQTLV